MQVHLVAMSQLHPSEHRIVYADVLRCPGSSRGILSAGTRCWWWREAEGSHGAWQETQQHDLWPSQHPHTQSAGWAGRQASGLFLAPSERPAQQNSQHRVPGFWRVTGALETQTVSPPSASSSPSVLGALGRKSLWCERISTRLRAPTLLSVLLYGDLPGFPHG